MDSDRVNTSDEEFSRAAAFLDYEAVQEGGNDKENYDIESENTDDRNFIDDTTPEKSKRLIKRKACNIISSSEDESVLSASPKSLRESSMTNSTSSSETSRRIPRKNTKDAMNRGPIISLIHRTKNILAAWEKRNAEILDVPEELQLKRQEAHALQQLLLSSMKLSICRYNQALLMDEKLDEACNNNWLLRQENLSMKEQLKKLKGEKSMLESTVSLYKTMVPEEEHI